MRNISDKSCREHQNTFCVQKSFSRKYYLMWDNVGIIWNSQTGHRWQYGACAL